MGKDSKIDWVQEKAKRIDELTENLSVSKYNLLKISFLTRLIKESFSYASTCSDCRNNLPELEKMIEEIPHLELIAHRSPYEKQFNSIRRHFHKAHGFIQPYHFTSRWTLIGVGIGLLLSVLWSLLKLGHPFVMDALMLGAALGLTAGYLWGSLKEARFRKAKKII